MWQTILWCRMTPPKHYPLRKREFYKGHNWDINGRFSDRTGFLQLSWAYIAGLDWQTLEKHIHCSTEPVILDLWLASEPCTNGLSDIHAMWLTHSAPVIMLWSTDQGNTPRYWMELGPRVILILNVSVQLTCISYCFLHVEATQCHIAVFTLLVYWNACYSWHYKKKLKYLLLLENVPFLRDRWISISPISGQLSYYVLLRFSTYFFHLCQSPTART